MAHDEIEPSAEGVTYGATIRPGALDAESVDGLGQAELDEWLVAHGRSEDEFTYFSADREGRVRVRGEGHVIDGEAYYRLAG